MVGATIKCCMIVCACCTIHACSELNDAPPRPVSFTWEVDSSLLQHGPFSANVLWGTDTNNIYLGVTNTTSYKSLFRWDGKSWSQVRFPVTGLWSEVYDIDGLDSSYFVAVGGGGIWGHAMVYDRGHWLDLKLPRIREPVTAVEVVSRNEIYVGGVDGILKYDGRTWTWLLDSTDSKVVGGSFTFWVGAVIKHPDGRLFFTAKYAGPRETQRCLWLWNGERFVIIDSTKNDIAVARFGAFFSVYQNTLVSAGAGVYTLSGLTWNRISDHHSQFVATDHARIAVGSWHGIIYCYNDGGWYDVTPRQLRHLGRAIPVAAVLLPKKFFFVAEVGFKSYIFHGTLDP